MKLSLNGYELKIIWKLHRHSYYGAKHTSIDHLKQGFRSNSGKEIKDAIDNLVKNGIVIVEKKTKEDHVCLNTNEVKLIHKIVDWFTDHMKEINKEELNKTYFEIENE